MYVRSKQRIVVMGLLPNYDHKPTVLMFDFLTRTWRRGADMPFNCYFSECAESSSPEGLIYFAGPLREEEFYYINATHDVLEAYAFNVEENKWDILPSMNPHDSYPFFCQGEFFDNKFYVVLNHGRSLYVYDPQRLEWKIIGADNNNQGLVSNCVSAFGRLYLFGYGGLQRRVREYDFANKSFNRIVEFPAHMDVRNVGSAVLCRDRIFATDSIHSYNEFYTHNIVETVEENRWTEIEMPLDFPKVMLSTATAVQILYQNEQNRFSFDINTFFFYCISSNKKRDITVSDQFK